MGRLMARKLALRVLPEPDWPEEDRAAWQKALCPGRLLDEPGPLAGRDADQTSALRASYGRWLGFLSSVGIDLRSSRGFDHFCRDNVAAFVDLLNAAVAPCSVRAYLTNLHTVAKAMAPDQKLEPLLGAVRHIWRTAKAVQG
jgi:hypothetical protein